MSIGIGNGDGEAIPVPGATAFCAIFPWERGRGRDGRDGLFCRSYINIQKTSGSNSEYGQPNGVISTTNSIS